MVRKTLRADDEAVDGRQLFEQAFKNEVRILALLRSLKHENIIQFLTSYTIETNPPTYNFLFSRADTSLQTILRDEDTDRLSLFFPTEYSLLRQLSGLTSAIESLHDFCSDDLKITLVGCHYDIAPRNILVQHERLLLSDFGLSMLRPDNSQSMYAKGHGDYLAPECESIQNEEFVKGRIGRASDIWSLGCILLEMYIYHTAIGIKGRQLKSFRERRKISMLNGEFNPHPFHLFDKPHPAVVEVLEALYLIATSDVRRRHVSMIREILVISPDERPKARAITHEIFLRAQETIYVQTLKMLEILCTLSTTFELVLERERFLLWGWGTQFIEDSSVGSHPPDRPLRQWLHDSRESAGGVDQLLSLVSEEVNELKTIIELKADHTRLIFARLRSLNDELWALLPRMLKATLQSQLEIRLLNSQDLSLLSNLQDKLSMPLLGREIALLATIRHMTNRFEKDRGNPSKRLLLDKRQIGDIKETDIHRISIFHGSHDIKRNVLVEYMSYDPEWVDKRHINDLYARADGLAELLSQVRMSKDFRILKCLGYYLEVSYSAIGLVYDFPAELALSTMPLSLKALIRWFRKPDIGTLFKLACSIVQCIAQFHRTQWLHKNINSYNIIFFNNDLSACFQSLQLKKEPSKEEPSEARTIQSNLSKDVTRHPIPQSSKPSTQEEHRSLGKAPRKSHFSLLQKKSRGKKGTNLTEEGLIQPISPSLEPIAVSKPQGSGIKVDPTKWNDLPAIIPETTLHDPYLVGFNHSRPDKNTAFTTGLNQKKEQKPYQHPEYLRSTKNLRFRAEFDYYSVGVVLLEIGLWSLVEDMAKGAVEGTDRGRTKSWLDDAVPQLGSAMGGVYRDAVQACIGGVLGGNDTGMRPVDLFDRMVVEELLRCYA